MLNFKNSLNYILGIFQSQSKENKKNDLILSKVERLYILKERAIKVWQKQVDLLKK